MGSLEQSRCPPVGNLSGTLVFLNMSEKQSPQRRSSPVRQRKCDLGKYTESRAFSRWQREHSFYYADFGYSTLLENIDGLNGTQSPLTWSVS